MSSSPSLKIDFCSYEAAKFAVLRWHYSRKMPAGKRVLLGIWEKGTFVGVVIFSSGAAPQAHCPFKIRRTEICELTRIAMQDGHETHVSRVISICLRFLRRRCPGIRVVVSYADPLQGHHGGVYQAANWTYCGISKCVHLETPSGREIHSKTFRTGRRGYTTIMKKAGAVRPRVYYKFKYVFPLDRSFRSSLVSNPYPSKEDAAEAFALMRPASSRKKKVQVLSRRTTSNEKEVMDP